MTFQNPTKRARRDSEGAMDTSNPPLLITIECSPSYENCKMAKVIECSIPSLIEDDGLDHDRSPTHQVIPLDIPEKQEKQPISMPTPITALHPEPPKSEPHRITITKTAPSAPTSTRNAQNASAADNRIPSDPMVYAQVQVAANVYKQAKTTANSIVSMTPSIKTFAQATNVKYKLLPKSAPLTVVPTGAALKDNLSSEVLEIPHTSLPIVIPTCSQWFNLDSIHSIEREQLAAIFYTPPSSEAISVSERESRYMSLRNQIVLLYRKNPSKKLTLTDARQALDCEVSLLSRVYAFLDFWGLINFQSGLGTTTFPATSDLMRSDEYKSKTTTADVQLEGGREFSHGPYTCASCGKVCLYSYYVLRGSLAKAHHGISLSLLSKSVWCLICYSKGKYPPLLCSSHFVKVDVPVPGTEASGWTEEETLKLLEGVERYMEDWQAIANFVGGGKSALMCLTRFVELPLEEPLISPLPATVPESINSFNTHWRSLVESSKMEKIPFADSTNPLMTQLALLSSLVHPSVAGAAAKAALDEALRINDEKASPSSALSPPTNTDEDIDMERPVSFSEETKDNSKQDLDIDFEVLCSTALAAAAVKTKQLAEVERYNAKTMIPQLLEARLQRCQSKIQYLKSLESTIGDEANKLLQKMSHSNAPGSNPVANPM